VKPQTQPGTAAAPRATITVPDVVTDVVDVGIDAVSSSVPGPLSIDGALVAVHIDPLPPVPASQSTDPTMDGEDDALVSSLLKSLVPPEPDTDHPPQAIAAHVTATDSGQSTTELADASDVLAPRDGCDDVVVAGVVGSAALRAHEHQTLLDQAPDPQGMQPRPKRPPPKPPAASQPVLFNWDNPNYRIYADLMKM
jgi:hypothetical protein